MARLRIAVIGAGGFGRGHVERIRGEAECEVAAIADPTPSAAAFASERRIPWFPEAAAMLDAARPDGVIVATPNALHGPAALACVERRVPILMEKPIAETLEASRTLVDAAERAGVPLLVGHHRRYNPIIEKARELELVRHLHPLVDRVHVPSIQPLARPVPTWSVGGLTPPAS